MNQILFLFPLSNICTLASGGCVRFQKRATPRGISSLDPREPAPVLSTCTWCTSRIIMFEKGSPAEPSHQQQCKPGSPRRVIIRIHTRLLYYTIILLKIPFYGTTAAAVHAPPPHNMLFPTRGRLTTPQHSSDRQPVSSIAYTTNSRGI